LGRIRNHPSLAAEGGRPPAAKSDFWHEAPKHWKWLGPPLRPVAEDIGFYTAAINEWVQSNGPPRVLLLGVTPELYLLPWPKGTGVLAVDRSRPMIDAVWPGPKDAVNCADWTTMTLPDGSRDIILCDGGMEQLQYPQEHGQLVRILRRVLSDGGLSIVRLYALPSQWESPETVLRDFVQGRVSNMNILKLRLGMALQGTPSEGVARKTIWNAFHAAAPNPDRLARQLGWSAEQMHVIDAFRDYPDRFFFLTVADLHQLFCSSPGGFQLESVYVPSYELGERCPTVVLRRRALASD
jgi:hypothetical protein